MGAHSERSSHDAGYARDTLEFTRVASLSDAVLAIALTLLVFILDASAVSLDRISGVLIDQRGPLIAFELSFAMIANFWWIHHRFFSNLGRV